jgi:putative transcriptional regulator
MKANGKRSVTGYVRVCAPALCPARFPASVSTIYSGRRVPEGPARAYLLVIDRAPEAAEKALRVG